MEVEVFADVLCPWSYIGKRRLERAMAGFGPAERERLTIRWRSYELSPDASRVPGLSAATSMTRWWGEEGTARVDQIHALARAEGLAIDLHLAHPVNTFDAHRVVHLGGVHGRADQVMERMLRGYLCEGLNISTPEVLQRLGVESGLDADAVRGVLAGDAHADAVRSDEQRAKDKGVTGVPMLVIEDGSPVAGIQPPADLRRLLADALSATAVPTID
ncbi:DsbA family oxidoreductase [Amycolatopsis sp. H6(2020)]|nr:DsbA family oxidoreductase [Amycolatopsis sp. H6(2020)]